MKRTRGQCEDASIDSDNDSDDKDAGNDNRSIAL